MVRAAVLSTADAIAEACRTWSGTPPVIDPDELVGHFQTAMAEAYGKPFEEIPFVKATIVAAAGFDDDAPVHYPRIAADGPDPHAPSPEGEAFKWFVENNRTGQNYQGRGLPLPDLDEPKGLPLYERH